MKENTENTEKTEAAEETELAEERKTGQKRRKKLSGRKKLAIALAAFVLFVGGVLGGLQIGVVWADKTWVHWRPDYEKTDITVVLDKAELTDEDYELLYRQTGLTKLGIDGLLEAGKKSQILKIQEFYFEELPSVANGSIRSLTAKSWTTLFRWQSWRTGTSWLRRRRMFPVGGWVMPPWWWTAVRKNSRRLSAPAI